VNAIETEGLGKRYRLGTGALPYLTLRETLAAKLRPRSRYRAPPGEFWALRDVDLAIAEGGTVGIIGPNGAGKTTLLKILARITEPTTGVARVRGLVGALLELGTGFHPELTGRENIYLNAAILGMSRADLRRHFEAIVEFSGVERFLDTPLKRYSSGMSVRLAFAVAAHLEPDIIVVDEVLAVGDAEFQRRCLARMGEMDREGRTVLFVSHDLGAIGQLCERVLWLDGGSIKADGAARPVIERYLTTVLSAEDTRHLVREPSNGDADVVSVAIESAAPGSDPADGLRRGDALEARIGLLLRRPLPALDVAIIIKNQAGVRILDEAWSDRRDPRRLSETAGPREVSLLLPGTFAAGTYVLEVWLGTPEQNLFWDDVLRFEILPRFDDRREWAERDRLMQLDVRWNDGGEQ
jgi:ABC-2 type transport system ATP-binding protein/lipopolysaccharide transport system ATP-binding protein